MSSSPSSPMLNVVQVFRVSPPPSTVQNRSLALTFFDMIWLLRPPVHHVFFYDLPDVTMSHFKTTIIPTLNNSLSTTLQHFFPYAGNLIIFPTHSKKPEIRYVQGDYVNITYSESCNDNLDFNDLTGNHPRNCDKFYHLIPPLGPCVKNKEDDDDCNYTKIPVLSVQVTLFRNHGISIGITIHHSLADATTQNEFLNAWTSISQSGTDELFRSRNKFPFYDREVISNPRRDAETLVIALNVESLENREYQVPHLYGPTNKVRATFIMTLNMVNRLKKLVKTHFPSIPYVSTFTVACAYIWSCLVKSCKSDELEILIFAIECRARANPSIPATYFGNCAIPCVCISETSVVRNEGFIATAKLIGEELHKVLTTEGGVLMARAPYSKVNGRTMIGVAGSPKMNFYDVDFGWGNPKKQEIISIDYEGAISMNASKESNENLEFGISLPGTQMENFAQIFNDG
ncbi:malonyl-coenzyme A:anthocyanin 3-O-glucoside-6''-O-malonyltransferase-like [Rutidosis leptorrhynchoides]|uniref:malonyl-coenzyme A:anthocyanin 3-O-glucoside-6''-O-malonyltransferase-like n=1 Tax=Rutidosis leptorrhynchoides TaxID=125765 RepID=UPI003A999FA9